MKENFFSPWNILVVGIIQSTSKACLKTQSVDTRETPVLENHLKDFQKQSLSQTIKPFLAVQTKSEDSSFLTNSRIKD